MPISSSPAIHHPPELMSPAGHWPQLQAAIEAGADAVYFGLNHFTARAKVGFTLSELPQAIRALHQRGVRGYLTFNTLIFDHELAEAARAIAAIAAAGVDALIVQDVGMARLASRIAPELPLHGSTQMSVTSAEGVQLAREFGISRVILARELSLEEIARLRAQTDCELEMFVHGALCVSYSGQCFSSEAWGGRSANRGQCAQACRLPYELLVDGQLKPLGEARYLLSPGDLYALRQVPELVKLGLAAFKIEGRYKDAEYVALTTRAYRQAVDEAWAGVASTLTAAAELQLEQVYSRGLGPYFIGGTDHQRVVSGRSPRHRGVLMGEVARVLADGVVMAPAPAQRVAPLKPGDGLVFDAAHWRSPQEREEGGRVYQVVQARDGVELRFGNGQLDFGRIRPGDLVWRSHDPDTDKAAQLYTQPGAPRRRQPLRVRVRASEGAPLETEWQLVADPRVQAVVCSGQPLAPAQNRGLDETFLREQLGRLGNTPYALGELDLEVQGTPFVPASLLGPLRRQAVEELARLQGEPPRVEVHPPAPLLDAVLAQVSPAPAPPLEPQLHLLVRTPEQLAAALAVRPASLTLDYLDLYGLRPAVEQVLAAGVVVRVASPRILKPGEERIAEFLLKLDCPLLVRAGGLLRQLQAQTCQPLTGDFSLNAANALSAQALLQLGLERLTPTHDLNAAQVAALAGQVGPQLLEVVAYQHLPVFHTEHCVFCRFLSTGTSYKDCGRPCEKHRVALRDTSGRAHPVLADVGCRNTVFGAQAQEASRHLDGWLEAGIRHFRLEFAHESAAQVEAVGAAFAAALAGQLPSRELGRRLEELAPQGTAEGSLFVAEGYLEVPLLE
ncbi:MAG: U32 family peptidase [Candidatus Latescibacteria bacterium]|nr:U32 family peptidase [Candidatus Latescibacterota bacterium]